MICWCVQGFVMKSEAPARMPCTARLIEPQAVIKMTGRLGLRALSRLSSSMPSAPVVVREKFMSCKTSSKSSFSIRAKASSGDETDCERRPACFNNSASDVVTDGSSSTIRIIIAAKRDCRLNGHRELNGGALAPLREIGILVQATVLAKTQRRKGREVRRACYAPLNFN